MVLLHDYLKNTEHLNRCVVYFLKTLGDKCNCEPLLYQVCRRRGSPSRVFVNARRPGADMCGRCCGLVA